MLKFTIRDLLWLMVVVALGVGWWLERREQDARVHQRVQFYMETMEKLQAENYRLKREGGSSAFHIPE